MAEIGGGFPGVSREFPAVVFVNPTAGSGRTRAYLSRIEKLFASRSLPAEFLFTESTEQLEHLARSSIANGRKLLLALGGDGTFQGLANAAFGSGVVVGVLPAGGGNDFASALGLPKEPLAAVAAILHGQPRWVDLVRAQTADGRERLYAGGGGVGLDAEAARYASGAFRRIPGRLCYIASALRALSEHEPLKVQIEFPESSLPPVKACAFLVGVLNTPSYGAGLRLAPDAVVEDGLLHVVVIEKMNALRVLQLLPRLVRSGELRTSHVQRWRVKRVRLVADRSCLFHGDGETFGRTPVEIEVVPRAIQVLAPAVG